MSWGKIIGLLLLGPVGLFIAVLMLMARAFGGKKEIKNNQ